MGIALKLIATSSLLLLQDPIGCSGYTQIDIRYALRKHATTGIFSTHPPSTSSGVTPILEPVMALINLSGTLTCLNFSFHGLYCQASSIHSISLENLTALWVLLQVS